MNEINETLEAIKEKVNNLKNIYKKTIEDLMVFATPEITRGPGVEGWVRTMRQAARTLQWPECHGCNGIGEPIPNCCSICRNIGYVRPEDI